MSSSSPSATLVAVIGLVPLGAGAANVCIVGKLFGADSDRQPG